MDDFEKELEVLEGICRNREGGRWRDLDRIVGLLLGMTNATVKQLAFTYEGVGRK